MGKLIAFGWYGGKYSHLDDPPYPHNSRGDSKAYAYEMTDGQHRELAHILHNVKGKVALSSYHCDLMDELYGDWRYVEADPKNCHTVKQLRTEVLWVNYEIEGASQWQAAQQTFFDQPMNEPLAI